ncbi:MAG: 3-deoxy-manno-octulosonate cytidylyltransferase [Desulfovibrionaceae bacterium]
MKTKNKYVAIIPSRYGSTRLHAKALHEFYGKPMFWHVYVRAKACSLFTDVYVATDDERISSLAKNLGVPTIMTKKEHESGTDRIFEACSLLNLAPDTVIANIQGDEPLVNPKMLEELLLPFEQDSSIRVSTLSNIMPIQDLDNPNKVKIALDKNNNALYFSRSPIPYNRGQKNLNYVSHIGIYAFTYTALSSFVSFPPALLEEAECLEQLRFLFNGIPIRVVPTQYTTHSVDEEKDLAIVNERLLKERTLYSY